MSHAGFYARISIADYQRLLSIVPIAIPGSARERSHSRQGASFVFHTVGVGRIRFADVPLPDGDCSFLRRKVD